MKKILLALAFLSLMPITNATELLFDNIGDKPETSFENYKDYATFEVYRIEERDELQYEQTPEQYLERQENMIPDDLSESEKIEAEEMAHSLKDKYESYWNNVN